MKYTASPYREYVLTVLLASALLVQWKFSGMLWANIYSTVAAAIGAIPVLLLARDAVRERRITINVMNAAAYLIAIAFGTPAGGAAIGLMLTFASWFNWRAETSRRDAVRDLLSLAPETADKVEGDRIVSVPVGEVHVGDQLLVREGSRVPVDAVIISGDGVLDESSISGEAEPVEKVIGDTIYPGTILREGTLRVRALKVGKETTLARLAALMLLARTEKSRSEKIADRFAAIVLPVLIVLGFIIFAITRDTNMLAAYFLVICIDEVSVAIPLAYAAALGGAAKSGVIVHGGEALDALAKVNTVVFDKTGTLTWGKFTVEHATITQGVDEKEFWSLVASAEKFSSHPIGRAIHTHAVALDGAVPDPSIFKTITGGVEAKIEGRVVDIVRAKGGGGLTTLDVMVDGRHFGSIAVVDAPKEGTRESIKALKDIGVHCIMLTGDKNEVAHRLAEEIGISEIHAGVLPEEKFEFISKLREKSVVAMVGDGINDAPALARANVGIAMGGIGSALAVEAADMIVLSDDIARIPEMILRARAVRSVVIVDVILWFVNNGFGILLVLLGFATPAKAAFYNFGTDFLPLINSMRLLLVKRR